VPVQSHIRWLGDSDWIVVRSYPICLSFKPCDRSLGAPLTHIERPAYSGPRKPFTSQRSHRTSVNLGAGPSELLALGARVPQTRLNPFLDR